VFRTNAKAGKREKLKEEKKKKKGRSTAQRKTTNITGGKSLRGGTKNGKIFIKKARRGLT